MGPVILRSGGAYFIVSNISKASITSIIAVCGFPSKELSDSLKITRAYSSFLKLSFKVYLRHFPVSLILN